MNDDDKTMLLKQRQRARLNEVATLIGTNFQLANLNAVSDMLKAMEEHDERLTEINNVNFTGQKRKYGAEHFKKVWEEWLLAKNANFQDPMFDKLYNANFGDLPFWAKRPTALFNAKMLESDNAVKDLVALDDLIEVDDGTIAEIQNSRFIGNEEEEGNDSSLLSKYAHGAKNLITGFIPGMSNQQQHFTSTSNFDQNTISSMDESQLQPKNNSTPNKVRARTGSKRGRGEEDTTQIANLGRKKGSEEGPPASKQHASSIAPIMDGNYWARLENIVATKTNQVTIDVNKQITDMKTEIQNYQKVANEAKSTANSALTKAGSIDKRLTDAIVPRLDDLELNLRNSVKADEHVSRLEKERFYNLYKTKCVAFKAKVDGIINDGIMKVDIIDHDLLKIGENGEITGVNLAKLSDLVGFDVVILKFTTRRKGKSVTIIISPASHVIGTKKRVSELVENRKNFKGKIGLGYAQDRTADYTSTYWSWKRFGIITDFSTSFQGFTTVILADRTRVKISEPEIFGTLDEKHLNSEGLKKLADEAEYFPWNGQIYSTPDFHKSRILENRRQFQEKRQRELQR